MKAFCQRCFYPVPLSIPIDGGETSCMLRRYARAEAKARKAAFSLVEMIIGVSVVAILAVMLAPFVKESMERAKSVKCVAHLRAVANALNAYASENDQKYPVVFDDGADAESKSQQTWMWQLKSYLDMPEDSMGSAPLPRAAGVFICPSFSHAKTAERKVSYALNFGITYKFSSGYPSRVSWNYSRNRIPLATTILVTEVGHNGETYSPISNYDAKEPLERRHPGLTANYAFADGHVETIRTPIPAGDQRWHQYIP